MYIRHRNWCPDNFMLVTKLTFDPPPQVWPWPSILGHQNTQVYKFTCRQVFVKGFTAQTVIFLSVKEVLVPWLKVWSMEEHRRKDR